MPLALIAVSFGNDPAHHAHAHAHENAGRETRDEQVGNGGVGNGTVDHHVMDGGMTMPTVPPLATTAAAKERG